MAVRSRRRFLKGAAVAFAGVGPVRAARAGVRDLVDAKTLWGWVEEMAAFGPRLPGSDAHRNYLDLLEERFGSSG